LPAEEYSAWFLLGLLNSATIRGLVHLQANDSDYLTGIIKNMPFPELSAPAIAKIESSAKELFQCKFSVDSSNETDSAFCFSVATSLSAIAAYRKDVRSRYDLGRNEGESTISRLIQEAFKIKTTDWLNDLLPEADQDDTNTDESDEDAEEEIGDSVAQDVLGYAVGCLFGRWDCSDKHPIEADPLDQPSVCSPGMLTGSDGLPAKETPPGYPLRIEWDGIMVDDPDHASDLVRRVREVLELLWKDRADAVEKEACDILGVKELRDYFRKPGSGGLWDDHVRRYSKSRRKAPIYWLLQSSKKNYALWLYYHRLDKDMLFKALVNYVEPKGRLEDDGLKALRARRAGASGRDARQLDRQIEKQDALVAELRDFEEKLRRAANLHLDPDLNDGVVLNIAPLWELVPWKEAKAYWQELLAGEYEWSTIGKQLREKGLVK
jgi:hypothetical protein